jgi:predicted HAD superfamily hydrolase
MAKANSTPVVAASARVSNIINLQHYRKSRTAKLVPVPVVEKNKYRGELFTNVHHDGRVDFGIAAVDLEDAPAMLMSTLIMSLRLARFINSEGQECMS